jgi:hypothetical protein
VRFNNLTKFLVNEQLSARLARKFEDVLSMQHVIFKSVFVNSIDTLRHFVPSKFRMCLIEAVDRLHHVNHVEGRIRHVRYWQCLAAIANQGLQSIPSLLTENWHLIQVIEARKISLGFRRVSSESVALHPRPSRTKWRIAKMQVRDPLVIGMAYTNRDELVRLRSIAIEGHDSGVRPSLDLGKIAVDNFTPNSAKLGD